MTFNIFKCIPYSKEELCNRIKVLNVTLVEKEKASSESRRSSSLLSCFNVGNGDVIEPS